VMGTRHSAHRVRVSELMTVCATLLDLLHVGRRIKQAQATRLTGACILRPQCSLTHLQHVEDI